MKAVTDALSVWKYIDYYNIEQYALKYKISISHIFVFQR